MTRREGSLQYQQGTINVTIPNGNTQGTAATTYPAAFATLRGVVTSSHDSRY